MFKKKKLTGLINANFTFSTITQGLHQQAAIHDSTPIVGRKIGDKDGQVHVCHCHTSFVKIR